METLTISRFLEEILRKEFHKVQDVQIYIGRQDIAALDASQSQ